MDTHIHALTRRHKKPPHLLDYLRFNAALGACINDVDDVDAVMIMATTLMMIMMIIIMKMIMILDY